MPWKKFISIFFSVRLYYLSFSSSTQMGEYLLLSMIAPRHSLFTIVYDSYFLTKVKSVYHGAIIDYRRYAPICVLEEKDRESKLTLKNILRTFFQGTCTVNYTFKVTSCDSLWHITDIDLLLYCDLTYWIGNLKTKTNLNSNWPDNWFGYDTISEKWYNLKRNVLCQSDGSGNGMKLSLILVPTF